MKILTLALLATTSLALAQQRSPFDNWDKNKDGKLSKEELPENARRNFDRVDKNGDGSISRAEHDAFRNRGRRSNPANNPKIDIQRDLPYAENDNPRQKLDLLLPKTRANESHSRSSPSSTVVPGGRATRARGSGG